MSYYGTCRYTLSKQQIGIMLYQIYTKNNREFILNATALAIKADAYEPDDTDDLGVPRLIEVDEKQCHSMNNNGDIGCTGFDQDWLRIENEDGILEGYRIIVRDITGQDNPVENIFIHNTDNVGLRTDNIPVAFIDNGDERIWEIPCDMMVPNTGTTEDAYDYNDFLIQVNKINEVNGFYEIKLERMLNKNPRLTDREQVCVGSVFNVTTLPEGATVTWTSQNMSLSNTTGASTTITAVEPETSSIVYEITAVIELDGCTYRLSDMFTEVASSTLPEIGSIVMDVVGNTCEPQFTFSVPQVSGATYYTWSCSSNAVYPATFYGCYGESDFGGKSKAHASAFLPNGEDLQLSITLTAYNDCGAEVTKSQGFLYRPDGDCNVHGGGDIRSVSITPNPVDGGIFTLEIEDDALVAQDYDIAIFNQYGSIAWMIESQNKVHQISTVTFLSGLYYAEVLSSSNLVTTAFYIQN